MQVDQFEIRSEAPADRPMADVPSFIEQQLPVSLLSKESYRERMAVPSRGVWKFGGGVISG